MAEFAGFDDRTAATIATGLIRRGEILLGDFTLRSGQWSPFYINMRTTSSAIEGNPNAPTMTKADQLAFRDSIVEGYVQMLEPLEGEYAHVQAIPEAVCGVAPIVGYVAGQSVLHRRINTKDHGTGEVILGDFHFEDRTVLIDDLITTAGAKLDEKTLLATVGLVAEHALVILDRSKDAIDTAAKEGLQVHAGLTLDQLIEIGHAEGLLDERTFKILTAYNSGELTKQKDIPNFV